MSNVVKWVSTLLLGLVLVGLVTSGYFRIQASRVGSVRGVLPADVPFGAGPEAASIPKGRPTGFQQELLGLGEVHKTLFNSALEDATAGRRDQALEGLEELMRAKPDFLPAYFHAAAVLRARGNDLRGDSLQALALYREALARDPGQPDILHALGEFYWEGGGRREACVEFRKAHEVAPHFAPTRSALGRCFIEEGDYAAAVEAFRLAVSLYEGGGGAPYDWLALAYWHLDKPDSVRAILEYASKRSLRSPRFDLLKGFLLELTGDIRAAESAYRTLLILNPRDREAVEALRTLGRKKSGEGSEVTMECAGTSEALAILESLTAKNPQSAPLWQAMGRLHFLRGDFMQSLASFDSSLSRDSTDAEALAWRQKADSARLGHALDSATRAAGTANYPGSAWTGAAVGVGGVGGKAGQGATTTPINTGSTIRLPIPEGMDARVVIPGASALLGSYNIYWGAGRIEVSHHYPKKVFSSLKNGNLKEVFSEEGLRLEQVLGFRSDSLWGIHVTIGDTGSVPGDVFGRALRLKTRISGEGRGTGPSKCEGFLEFQGVIWENEDTFEFMAQFEGRDGQVRLVRVGRQFLPADQRLCSLVELLDPKRWEN